MSFFEIHDHETEADLTRIAYHECGHAIAAVLEGGVIDRLSIEPDNEDESLPLRSGEIQVIWPPTLAVSEAELAVSEIKVALAGPIVEMIYDESQFAPHFLEEWRYDWELAVARAQQYLPSNRSVPEHLAQLSHSLLTVFEKDENWAAVATLADELEAHMTLEPDMIAEILEVFLK